jgi:hypothetical protein
LTFSSVSKVLSAVVETENLEEIQSGCRNQSGTELPVLHDKSEADGIVQISHKSTDGENAWKVVENLTQSAGEYATAMFV